MKIYVSSKMIYGYCMILNFCLIFLNGSLNGFLNASLNGSLNDCDARLSLPSR